MKKWENDWCSCESLLALSENCNDRGQERWEVVSVFFNGKNYVAWLKREIPELSEIAARREAALKILHNETLDLAQRLDIAFKIALGESDPPAEKKSLRPLNEHPFEIMSDPPSAKRGAPILYQGRHSGPIVL